MEHQQNKEMTEAGATTEPVTTTPWHDSRAKAILLKGLEDGTIPLTVAEIGPKDVFKMDPEFQKYKYENFRTNLNTLRKATKSRKVNSAFDEDALQKDRQIVQRDTITQRGYPFWPESDARKLLERDLKEGRHLRMTPKILHMTRPEYRIFPLSVFRDHIHQELRCQRERPYWNYKKSQKKRQRQGIDLTEYKGQNKEAGNILY